MKVKELKRILEDVPNDYKIVIGMEYWRELEILSISAIREPKKLRLQVDYAKAKVWRF